ncbi:thiazole biosynthesis ThiG family protein [Synechococcus sp. WH 8103]|nr:thiazole biosynthesis ThiG family protein [Synechococcus sp. WH 8103]
MDAVASLYDRNNLYHIIESACEEVFVPIAVGGGIRTLDDISYALDAGADKVIINTGAIRDIQLIEKGARRYGSQCIVGSIEAKKLPSSWEAYVDNGREPTSLDALLWAQNLEKAGCGEILVTSIDQEGTNRGFDIDLLHNMNLITNCPVIASGGYGKPDHLKKLLAKTSPSAVAFASALHYEKYTVDQIRSQIADYTFV